MIMWHEINTGNILVRWGVDNSNIFSVKVLHSGMEMFTFGEILGEKQCVSSACLPNWLNPQEQVKLLTVVTEVYKLFLENKSPQEMNYDGT